jgi:type II secretory pathway pseudopilin PulG
MTENSIVLLACTVVIVILAALLYAAGRRYHAALTKVGELSATLAQILAGNRNIEDHLEQQRRVLYDAHKRIHAVTKGLSKPLS